MCKCVLNDLHHRVDVGTRSHSSRVQARGTFRGAMVVMVPGGTSSNQNGTLHQNICYLTQRGGSWNWRLRASLFKQN